MNPRIARLRLRMMYARAIRFNMNLREYAASLPPGGQAELARNIGVARTFLYQMIRGIRPVPSLLCKKIELATYGAVTAAELRPDLAAIFGPPATAEGH